MALLEIKHLKTTFNLDGEVNPAVDDVSFSVEAGKTLAVIGESGSGKSVTALSIMGLVDPPGKIESGEVLFEGVDLMKLSEKNLRSIRGNRIAMVYQDPMSSLNPMIKVGQQIEEVLWLHKKMDKHTLKQKTLDLMESVGISDSALRYHYLPDKFSGGMRQRLMIAMAIACDPELLIADEPTTALDVTIQAEILDLLRTLKKRQNMAMILNTHDLGVVSEMADDVVVMYCGKVMEIADITALFNKPLNPYTQALMTCMPRIDDPKRHLETIPGHVPELSQMPKGCRFSNRCKYAFEKCGEALPELREIEKGHWSRCLLNSPSSV